MQFLFLKIIFCDIFKSAEREREREREREKRERENQAQENVQQYFFFTQQWPDNLFTTLTTHEVQTGMSYHTPTLNSAAITFHKLLHLK